MPRLHISPVVRELVRRRAGAACEYCGIGEDSQVAPFHCDHWLPRAKGGLTVLENLVWACPWCNGAKHAATVSRMAKGVATTIFNPRRQQWSDHFRWSNDLRTIVGVTSTGRGTIRLLKLNAPKMQRIRQLLIELGLHPSGHSRR